MASAPISSLSWIGKAARYALYLAAASALLVIVLYAAVPAILRHMLETNLAAQVHRAVSVRQIHFNPLTLSARIDGLTVQSANAGAQPLLDLDALTLDVSLASIWHRAPVLDRVTIDRPRVAFARNDDGSYSVQDLLDAALADDSGPPTRFSINNIEIHDGAIDFDDRPRQRKHEVRDLNIGIPFLSSLPYQTKLKVLPHVFARVNGSPFGLSGTTTPFARERDASLDIDLDVVPLTQYLAYLPIKLRAKVPSGTLSSRAKLVFSEGDPQSRSLWLSGEFTLDNFVLQRANGTQTVSIPRARAHVARLDIFHRALVVDSLDIERPALTVRRGTDGAVDLAQPWIEAAAPSTSATAAADTSPPWQVDVEKAAIAGGVIHVDDASVKPAYRVAYSGVTLDATDLSNAPSKRAHLRIAMTSEFGAAVKADVDMIPSTLDATGHVQIDRLSLRRLYPYYADTLNLDVQSGSLSIAGDFVHTPDPKGANFTINAGAASLDDLKLALHGEHASLWRVPSVAMTGIVIDVAAKRARIGVVQSRGGVLGVRRDHDGGINFARLISSAPETGRGDAHDGTPTWSVVATRAVFDRYSIDVDDQMPTPPVTLQLRGVEVRAQDLSNAGGKPGHVAVRATAGEGGRIALEGTLATNPFAARMRVDASGLALAPLQPYLDPYANVTVTAGTLALSGRLVLSVPDNANVAADAHTRFNGDLTVSDFAALDTPAQGELARWKRLALTGVDVSMEPPRLAIGAITLQDYFARIILHGDATLNFVRLLKPRAAAATPAAANPATVPAAAGAAISPALPAATAPGMPISLGKITLAGGSVRYSDLYIHPNYTANLSDVAGSVSAMSATQAGDVDIAAKVEQTAPVAIKGTVNPFAREITLDLAGSAHDVDLPPLSPYAVKYAGYGITKGKLSFDVRYRIRDRRLVADNKLVVDQLTFGQRVDSPTATRLPVQLAVALLKDANGVIDIELPISGSLDDPQFSVMGLIGKVIVNLLEKAVTAPFALLGAAFGGGGEEMSYVAFAPGTSVPVAAGEAKLDKLGKGLGARPELKVDIAGHVDMAADSRALIHDAVERLIRAQKIKALVAAGTPPPSAGAVVVDAAERLRYLTAAYKEAPIKERPRNFFGILKDVAPADMESMLAAHSSVDDDALRGLAQRRAQAVKEALVKRGVVAERLFIVAAAAQPTKGAKGAPDARVDLALK